MAFLWAVPFGKSTDTDAKHTNIPAVHTFRKIRTKRKSRLLLFFLAKSFLTPLEVERRPVSQISRHVKPTREKDSRVLSGFVFCVFYGFRRCNKTNPNISWSTWKIIQVLMTCRADRFRRHIRWQLTGVDLICPFTLPDAVNCQTVNKSLNDEYS